MWSVGVPPPEEGGLRSTFLVQSSLAFSGWVQ